MERLCTTSCSSACPILTSWPPCLRAACTSAFSCGCVSGAGRQARFVGHALLGVLVLLPSAYFIFPPADSALNIASWREKWTAQQVVAFGQAPLRCFLPVPAWWDYTSGIRSVLLEARNRHPDLPARRPARRRPDPWFGVPCALETQGEPHVVRHESGAELHHCGYRVSPDHGAVFRVHLHRFHTRPLALVRRGASSHPGSGRARSCVVGRSSRRVASLRPGRTSVCRSQTCSGSWS